MKDNTHIRLTKSIKDCFILGGRFVCFLKQKSQDKEITMTQGLKRPIQGYLFQVLWISMMLYWSTINSSEIGRWILWAGAFVGIISLAHMILKRNYFEVVDNKLIINEGILKRIIIDLDKIEKLNIEPGPFTASTIILKDKTKIKYSDRQTDDKKLKEFMGQYNIPVE
jgi:hypothetical protein